MSAISLLGLGVLLDYFSQENKTTNQSKPDSSSDSESQSNVKKIDTFLIIIKGAKKCLKYSGKIAKLFKYTILSGITSIRLSDWIFSPKGAESSVLLMGTIGMAYLNFKPFKEPSSLFSKVKIIGGSLLAESNNILTMHQLMVSISGLAKSSKPPIKELVIAGSMILTNKIAHRYFTKPN